LVVWSGSGGYPRQAVAKVREPLWAEHELVDHEQWR
jgi:hypothetical protein